MVTGGLLHLHHHLHPRPSPLHLADSRSLLLRRSALNRPATPSKLGLLQPIPRSIQCVKQEGSDGEVLEWVNKATRDPMVEFDPVTVFRRIVAERHASAMARAQEEANLALQTTSHPPVLLGSKWPAKSAIAIATALVLLAVAAALYFLRSRKGRDEAMELTSADTKDTLESSRRRLVKDTIKAPESVLTAMALGAASVSRPKGQAGSTHDTLYALNGNVVESQRPQGATDFYPIVNTVAVEDMESDLHGKPSFGHNFGNVEEFTPLNLENAGVDVTEGPWFGQVVNDTEMLVPAEVEELESEKPAVGEGKFEAVVFASMMDGDFHGEVVAVSEQPNHSSVQVLEFKFEDSQIDDFVAESSTTAEEHEQIVKEGLITSLEGKGVADDTAYPEQDVVTGLSALDLSNGQFDETDLESNDDDDGDIKYHAVEQSFTPNPDNGFMSVEASDSKSGFEEVQVAEGYLLCFNSDSLSIKEEENISNLLSGVDQTLEGIEAELVEGIEAELDDVLDGVLSTDNAFQMGLIEEAEGLVNDTGKESLTDSSASLDPFDCKNLDSVANLLPIDAACEEDSREDSKKALKAAVPAIAIGVGTVGALFGVAGGLQVVGFAALASFISQDFFWAQNRESLWQELHGITDRQKLLDFLAKRNIMRMEREKPSL